MKNLFRICAGTVLLTFAVSAQARTPYGMAGCGLGSMVFDSEGGQISAATTNNSFSSQGFGITSGTSNCVEVSKAAALSAQQQFMNENFVSLAKEIAQGKGESLHAFATTFGCSQASYPLFATTLQHSYSTIFTAPGSGAALESVQAIIKSDKNLARACALVI